MKGTQSSASGIRMILLSVATLVTAFILVDVTTPVVVYAQNATSVNETATSKNATTSAAGASDFKTIKDDYFAKWKQLDFKSAFDTFIDSSASQYGVYDEHPSNIYGPDARSIVLYVEPVGFGHKEGLDEQGNVLYGLDFQAVIEISDKGGLAISEPIPADLGSIVNSHRQVTEVFMPIRIDLDQPLPIGEYTITYTITDNTSGKNFKIVKDIRVAETVS